MKLLIQLLAMPLPLGSRMAVRPPGIGPPVGLRLIRWPAVPSKRTRPILFAVVSVAVVDPAGALVTSSVAVAEFTVATVPLNLTVFWLGVALKLVPAIVTVAPTGPLLGVNSMIETAVEPLVAIESRLPTAS